MIYNFRKAILASLCLLVAAVPARAQRYFEAAAGWDFVSTSANVGGNEVHSYPSLRASVGEVLAPHFRLRFDADAMLVDFRDPAVECPGITCPRTPLSHNTRGIFGIAANAIVNLESTGTVYALGGAGAYEAYTNTQTIQAAVSGGLGLVLKRGTKYGVVLDATAHYFGSNGAAPSWIIPVTLGLRF
jgi:hypothetical protein